MSTSPSTWLIWQLVDSAFPTGGFAHSWGLEAAWQHGEVSGPEALERFVANAILQAGHGVLPLVTAAHDDPTRLEELDVLADAFLTSEVANRASRAQGRALISTCQRVWPSRALTNLATRAAALAAHVAPMAGVTFRTMGVPRRTAQEILLFGAARGVLAAAVRLGLAGSYEAQRLQSASAPICERVVDACGDLDVSALAQTAPLIDIWQGAHDRLYSRLFQS